MKTNRLNSTFVNRAILNLNKKLKWQNHDEITLFFGKGLRKSTNLRSSFRKIIFKVGTCLYLQVFNLDMLRDERRRFITIFQKDETNLQKWFVESIR